MRLPVFFQWSQLSPFFVCGTEMRKLELEPKLERELHVYTFKGFNTGHLGVETAHLRSNEPLQQRRTSIIPKIVACGGPRPRPDRHLGTLQASRMFLPRRCRTVCS